MRSRPASYAPSTQLGWLVGPLAIGLCACAGSPRPDEVANAGPFEGIGSIDAPLLLATCTATMTGVSIVVGAGETLYVTMRPNDGKVTLNANLPGNKPCETTATSTLAITATGNNHTVILDYVNGLFMKASVAPLLTMDLTGGTNTVKIRGSNGVDRFSVGAGAVAGTQAFNLNQGTAMTVPVGDALPDATWKAVQSVVISTGPGNDIIDAAGTFGTGTAYPNALKLFGGAGNDTITGGLGADTIVGGDNDDIMEGGEGDDVFVMANAVDGNDTVGYASANASNKTVDYTARTNAITLNIDNTATSGEVGETDKIHDKIATILSGAGDDTITVGAMSTVAHVIKGGLGNDTITGGAGVDVVDGQQGDDVMAGNKCTADYSGRSAVITATLCNSGCAAENNDGDQGASYVVNQGAAAVAGADDGMHIVTITGLTSMTTKSVGRNLVISGSMAMNDGTYPIVTRNSATSVDVDVTGNASFQLMGSESGLTWQERGAEADNVQCANIAGGTGNDTITGDSRNNLIWGNDGNDVLTGGTGDDSLFGGVGTDTLYGGQGADTLDGAAGADTLFGGDDSDVLTGGTEADAFTCNGKNAAGGMAGSRPGDSDFTVDFSAMGGDTGALDCAF